MKKKTTPQPRNHLVKLALFRKAGSHKKSNKAIRRLEKSKKSGYSEAYLLVASRGLIREAVQNDNNLISNMLHYKHSVHS